MLATRCKLVTRYEVDYEMQNHASDLEDAKSFMRRRVGNEMQSFTRCKLVTRCKVSHEMLS